MTVPDEADRREALEPCPFCGSKMVAQGATAQKTISVWCMECGTRGPDVPFPDFCEPVAQIELCHQRWNTRAAAAQGEPCAWRWRWLTGSERDREWSMWTYSATRPTNTTNKVVEPLYSTPQPASYGKFSK